MSTDERARIRALASEGLSLRAIARKLGLSKSAVHRVLMAPDPEDPPDYEDPDGDGDEGVRTVWAWLAWLSAWAGVAALSLPTLASMVYVSYHH